MRRTTMLAAAMLAALVGGLASLAWAQGPAEASFPGKNGRIAFSAYEGGYSREGNLDVFSVLPDGTGLRRLTDSEGSDTYPSFSADGEKIAFGSRRGEGEESAIWTMDADGTRERQATFTDADSDFGPTFSPGGGRLAYSHLKISGEGPGYPPHIHALNLSNGRERGLTPGFEVAYAPSWSPDGRRIAFAGDKDGQGSREVYTVKTDGTGLKRLTDNEADEDFPSWSPDSSKIVFHTDRTGEVDPYCDPDRSSCDPLSEIYVMGRDGSNQTRLTHPVPEVGPGENPGEGPDSSPAFSPNGRKIAFVRSFDELWTMRADGSGEAHLADIESNEYQYVGNLSWQPLPRR